MLNVEAPLSPLNPAQGHADEVAAVGSSLSSYFEVYHRLLARSLELAATAAAPGQLERLSGELAEACASGQHTYAHAQHLLAYLAARDSSSGGDGSGGGGSGGSNGTPFRRLAQELEAAAVSRHEGRKVWAMQPLFVPAGASPRQREAVRLMSSALVQGLCGDAAGGGVLTQVGRGRRQLPR